MSYRIFLDRCLFLYLVFDGLLGNVLMVAGVSLRLFRHLDLSEFLLTVSPGPAHVPLPLVLVRSSVFG